MRIISLILFFFVVVLCQPALAQININQLPPTNSANGSDWVPIFQNGKSVKVQVSNISGGMVSGGGLGMQLSPTNATLKSNTLYGGSSGGGTGCTPSGSINAIQYNAGGGACGGSTVLPNAFVVTDVNGVPTETQVSPTSTITTISKVSNYSVLSGDNATYFDNGGAAAEVDFTLPSTTPGLHYCFLTVSNQIIKVLAGSGQKIALGTNNSIIAGNAVSSIPFSEICLHAPNGLASQWISDTVVGSWTVN